MKKRNLLLFVIAIICALTFAVPVLSRSHSIKQDVALNTEEWNTIYKVDSFDAIEGIFLGVINDGNNDDEIYIRVLDENNNIVCQPCLIELGEQKELDFMKNGYVIQSKSNEINGYYRICIVKKGMIV